MTLKKQLLLVSLLTLMLPWAGIEFIRETESALRTVQQQMLAGIARAHAITMAKDSEEFPVTNSTWSTSDQLYMHELTRQPAIDGYFDDWSLGEPSLRSLRGTGGSVKFVIASFGAAVFLYVEVSDRDIVYATAQTMIVDDGPRYADRVTLVSSSPPYRDESFIFAAEAPGPMLSYKQDQYGFAPEPAITARWQDIPGRGYNLEARFPASILGTNLGVVVSNTSDTSQRGTRSQSYYGTLPPGVVRQSPELGAIAESLVQTGTRLLVTDAAGWRIAATGELSGVLTPASIGSAWSQRAYDMLVESGKAAAFAEPDPHGRERQPYIGAALDGREMASWFRSGDSGRAIVAVAAPIMRNDEVLGALVLQQGTDAILSLANDSLARLINVTLIATLLVAGTLLGYATWLSRRIRHLSVAAEQAMENEDLHSALPSALAYDEIGDLSRSLSSVLQQLGDYNEYLRTLASKLSHELRTPLAIVTSSLENLEHEALSESSAEYTARAREGADRLRRILSAMSEASRVEELMSSMETDSFDMCNVLNSTIAAYRDVYPERTFQFDCDLSSAVTTGSPELLVQMLDKLVDNAVDFSNDADTIVLGLEETDSWLFLSIANPGPPLPERMRTQLFDSMVSMRSGDNSRHLGLGLYVARLIAEGHGGRIAAENVADGVVFTVRLPLRASD
jgi:dedicated sortase system histidine kinase